MKPSTAKLVIAFSVLNLIGLIALGVIYVTRQDQIVYVESKRLIDGYKGTVNARKSLEEKTSVWRANIDTLTNEVQNDILKFTDGLTKMTAKEKKLQDELIKSKQLRLSEYRQTIENQVQLAEAEMTRTVLTEINVFIKKYGEQKGYTIIIAATDYGNIAFARPDVDVTDEILAGLNQQYVGK